MLVELWKQNYSIKEIVEIVNNNKLISINNLFSMSHPQLEYCDTMIPGEPLSGFIGLYDKEPSFFADKVELYKTGLDILMNKHCNLTFVEF